MKRNFIFVLLAWFGVGCSSNRVGKVTSLPALPPPWEVTLATNAQLAGVSLELQRAVLRTIAAENKCPPSGAVESIVSDGFIVKVSTSAQYFEFEHNGNTPPQKVSLFWRESWINETCLFGEDTLSEWRQTDEPYAGCGLHPRTVGNVPRAQASGRL